MLNLFFEIQADACADAVKPGILWEDMRLAVRSRRRAVLHVFSKTSACNCEKPCMWL